MKTTDNISAQLLVPTLMAVAEAPESELRKMGLDRETINLIRKLSVSDITVDAPRYAHNLLNVTVEADNLKTYIAHRLSQRCYESQLDDAISHGINYVQLNELTGIGRDEFRQRRQRQGMPPVPRGRVGSLTEQEEEVLYRSWVTWRSSFDNDAKLQLLLRISEDTAISISRIYKPLIELESLGND